LIARLPLSGVVDIRLCELGLVEPRVDLMSYVYDGNGNGVSKTVRGDRAVLFDMLPPPRKMRYSYTLLRGFWGAGQILASNTLPLLS
jgi:YD repeat-containing protein